MVVIGLGLRRDGEVMPVPQEDASSGRLVAGWFWSGPPFKSCCSLNTAEGFIYSNLRCLGIPAGEMSPAECQGWQGQDKVFLYVFEPTKNVLGPLF